MISLRNRDPGGILRRYSVFFLLGGLIVLLTILSGRFLSPGNLLNITLQSSVVAIVAMGMTFTILTGGIDLSVGAVVALSGAVASGLIVRNGAPPVVAIAVALLAGLAIGGVNGLLVVKGGIPPFVATLSLMAIARGVTLVYTQGRPISGMDDSYLHIGTGSLGVIPMPIVILAVVVLLSVLVLRYTRFGIHVYAVGGSEETARLAGVKCDRVKFAVYCLSGFASTLAGIVLSARLWSAQPTAGTGLELEAIAATVIGGTSLSGGYGGPGGTLLGVFIMGTLSNGLNLLRISAYYQRILKGIIFILAVMFDVAARKRRR